MYVAQLVGGCDWFKPDGDQLINWGASFGPNTINKAEYWRLLTSIFVHAGIIHLALNLYALIGFGPMAETALGRWRYLFIFVLSGIVGGLASILGNPTNTSVGCSGAVLGIIGAFMLSCWLKRADISVRLTRPQLVLLMVFLGYSTILGLTSSFVDNAAHMGGFVTGIFAGWFLTGKKSSSANLFNSAPAKALAITMVVPILIACDTKRLENNLDVKAYLDHRAAIVLLKEKKFLHGIELLDRALSYRPNDASILSDRATALTEIEQYEKALLDIDVVIKQGAKEFVPFTIRANIYHKLKDDDKAILDMNAAIARTPKNALLFNNRAWYKLSQGAYQSALNDCDHSIKLKELDTAYGTRAMAYYLLGQFQKADDDLIHALKMKEKEGGFHYHRALVLFATGKNSEANAELKRYSELDYKPEAWEPKPPVNANDSVKNSNS